MFIHTNQPSITSFSIKKVPNFCRISDESALVRNFLRNEREGINRSGAWELKYLSIRFRNFKKVIITECSGPSSCKKNRNLKFSQSEHILEIQDIGIHLDDLHHFEIDWIFEEDNARVDCMFDDKNENQGKVKMF